MSDDAKKMILARRARFVALAVASMTTGCPGPGAPQPCLSQPAPQVDGGGEPGPSVPRPPEVPK